MAGVLTADAAGEVDERAAVDVGDARTVRVRDDEFRGRDAAADVAGRARRGCGRARRSRWWGSSREYAAVRSRFHRGNLALRSQFGCPAYCAIARIEIIAVFVAHSSVVARTARALLICHDCPVTHTVLIVDDHPSFRASARAILEADGFRSSARRRTARRGGGCCADCARTSSCSTCSCPT